MMSDVQRICPVCGQSNPLESRYCAHCGDDGRANLPARPLNLPMVIGQAALPVLATAAGLALRVGWRLLQNRLARAAAVRPPTVPAAQPAQAAQPAPASIAPRTQAVPAPRPRRTIHIRSAWIVSDGQGRRQQGVSEHTIEMDD